MEYLHERIAAVVVHSKLTQAEFAKRINIARSMVSEMCSGKKNPSDRTISDICREFNVSESWLREGTGAMLIPVTADQMLAQTFGKLISGRDEAADDRKIFLKMLMSLTPEQLAAVKRVILEMAKEFAED